MTVSVLENYKSLIDFVFTEVEKLKFSTGKKEIKASITLLMLSLDHAKSVAILLENKQLSSAFSLMRPVWEDFIRGFWVANCASEKQIEMFITKDKLVHDNGTRIVFRELVEDVQDKMPDSSDYLIQLQKHVWPILNGLTHNGMLQLNNNFDGLSIASQYTIAEENQAIKFLTFIVSLAFSEIVEVSTLSDSEDLIDSLLKIMEPWAFDMN